MQALVSIKAGEATVKEHAPLELGSKDILVKVQAVALNPTDWKHIAFGFAPPGAIAGCDFAGVVDKVADGVTAVKVGDKVAGFVQGGQLGTGAFAEYVKIEGTMVWKIPGNIDLEEAAALGGIGPDTAFQALYLRHNLARPSKPSTKAEPFLVWGGSSSVGLYAVQFAKLSGYTVVATSSPKNFDLIKSLGATDVFDYNDKETPAKIAAAYPTLAKALDCVSEKDTSANCVRSLGAKAEGKKHVLRLLPDNEGDNAGQEDVQVDWTLVYTLFGIEVKVFGGMPANPADKKAKEAWIPEFTELVASGKLKANPLWRREGGLARIQEGLEDLKAGKNSAQKLTYKF